MSEPFWLEMLFRFQGNDSVVWAGCVANPKAWEAAPGLVTDLDPPWYHCAQCIEDSRSDARLSIGSKFCAKCGTHLDWTHMDWEPEDVEAFRADLERRTGKKVTIVR